LRANDAASLLGKLYPDQPPGFLDAGIASAMPSGVNRTPSAARHAETLDPEAVHGDAPATGTVLLIHPPAAPAGLAEGAIPAVALPVEGVAGVRLPDAPAPTTATLRIAWPVTAPPGGPAATLPAAAVGHHPSGSAAASRTAADGGKRLAINHADADEIRQKLRIDARRARLIIEFRQTYGPFRYPDDVREVNGITDQMVQVWEEQDLLALD
jgi:hypothetical protein